MIVFSVTQYLTPSKLVYIPTHNAMFTWLSFLVGNFPSQLLLSQAAKVVRNYDYVLKIDYM